MIQKIKQFKNLILLVLGIALLAALIASDPLCFIAKRSQERAAIYNQMAIEKAEAERQIAVIEAEKKAQIRAIELGVEYPGTLLAEPR